MTTQEDLISFALAALPQWFKEDERAFEAVGAAAYSIAEAYTQNDYWFSQAQILLAEGPAGVDPDWLNQHARDRGTGRQAGETDAALRDRLRNVPDALTRPTLLSAAQSIVNAEGIVGVVAMVELRRDKAFFDVSTSDAGMGGEITAPDAGGFQTFTPATPFARPPYRVIEELLTHKLRLVGAPTFDNNGLFEIVGLVGNAAKYSNPAGAAEVTAGVWEVEKYDRIDNLRDGFRRAYYGRGYRFGTTRPTIIFILPFGCTAGTAASVLEMARQKKGAGVIARVECRLSP